jgi:hypothetical protein
MVALAQIESIEKDSIKIKAQTARLSETYKERFFSFIRYSAKSAVESKDFPLKPFCISRN